MADNPNVDYYLCLHCKNYAITNNDVNNLIPDWKESADGRLGNFDQLHTAFLLLSPDQRMVIYLKFMKGLSNHDVAELLSKSIGAVKAIQYRGLINLMHILSPAAKALQFEE